MDGYKVREGLMRGSIRSEGDNGGQGRGGNAGEGGDKRG